MATKLSTLMQEVPALRRLSAPLKRLQKLHDVYSDAVPNSLSKGSRVGYLDGATLVVIAHNGTIAANLRQRLPTLLSCVQSHISEVTGIRIEVQVGNFYTSAPNNRNAKRSMSSSGARSLDGLADVLPDSPLRQALKRLASRAEASDKNQPLKHVNEADSDEKHDKKPE